MRTEFWEIGGAIWTDGRRPEVRIAPPISKNEVCIYRCVRARLTAYTLLLSKLKPATKDDSKTVLCTLFDQCVGGELPLTAFLVLFPENDERNKISWKEIAYIPSYGSEQRQELNKLNWYLFLEIIKVHAQKENNLIWNNQNHSFSITIVSPPTHWPIRGGETIAKFLLLFYPTRIHKYIACKTL